MRTDRQSRAALAPPRPAAAATGGGSGSGSGSGSGGVISASAAAIRATLNDKMGWFGLGGSHPNSPPGPSTGTTSSGMEESMGGEDGNGSEEGLRGVLPSYASYLPPFITPHIKKKKKKNKHNKAGQPGQPPKCTYKEVPDPSNDAELMKLAVLEFDCEVKNARQSIPDIASRLAPHGFYRSSLARHNMSYGNRCVLKLHLSVFVFLPFLSFYNFLQIFFFQLLSTYFLLLFFPPHVAMQTDIGPFNQ